jgi:hypothetical protein
VTSSVTRDEALVDLYRDVLKMKQDDRAPVSPAGTPGTGRSCKPNRLVPSKRIKALHRSRGDGVSLKAFARSIVHNLNSHSADDKIAAVRWLSTKGARP